MDRGDQTATTGRRVLCGERVLTADGMRPAAVVIEGERIAAVVAPEAAAGAGPVIDCGDLVIMPGLVDCHVHVNEPGRTEWEGFETATRAAAAGGVTTIVDMPLNCLPVTTTAAALGAKLESLDGSLWVDAGFWGGVVPGNADALAELVAAGVLGCKAFLVHSGIDEFPDCGEDDLRRAMPILREAGVPLLAHAELDLGGADAPSDPRTYAGYLASRPPAWEDAAIALLVRLCRETGCPVHIVHLSSAGSLAQLAAARAEGLPVTVETCPHYLCLSAEEVADGDTLFKCAPPIRGRDNREGLWRGLADGVIDLVVTDHSPCTPALKRRDEGDFSAAWGGIASLQLGLPAVWTEARARGLAIERLAGWMSERPAALAGLGHRKGRIAPGFDADLVIWDPDAEIEVTAASLHLRHPVSPYLGRRLRGEVRATWLRGVEVFRDGAHCGGPRGAPLLGRGAPAPSPSGTSA
jgi:allantoinase